MKLTARKPSASAKRKGAKAKSAARRQSFDFKSFWNSVNSLNAQNYGLAPMPVKIFLMAMLVVALSAIAWLALLKPKLNYIEQAEGQQKVLLDQYREKESKARFLDEYKAQVEQMQVDFSELLSQLPKGKMTADLIEGITVMGSGSGIRFQEIVADPEVEQEFFIEQPIRITAIGDYHQIGNFMTGIASLPRIITMHNFDMKNEDPSLDVMPETKIVLETKTYRSKEIVEEDAANANAPAAAGQEGASK